MIVTQEQVDKYVAETLQPLTDGLLEYAKVKKIPSTDFYLVCVFMTKYALDKMDGPRVEALSIELGNLASAWCTEEVRQRMEEPS